MQAFHTQNVRTQLINFYYKSHVSCSITSLPHDSWQKYRSCSRGISCTSNVTDDNKLPVLLSKYPYSLFTLCVSYIRSVSLLDECNKLLRSHLTLMISFPNYLPEWVYYDANLSHDISIFLRRFPLFVVIKSKFLKMVPNLAEH